MTGRRLKCEEKFKVLIGGMTSTYPDDLKRCRQAPEIDID